jgi:hypothetical protein
MSEVRTAEQRTQDFTAMGHIVDLINDIIPLWIITVGMWFTFTVLTLVVGAWINIMFNKYPVRCLLSRWSKQSKNYLHK